MTTLSQAYQARIDEQAALVADDVTNHDVPFDEAFARFERATTLGPKLRIMVKEQAEARAQARWLRDHHLLTVRVYEAWNEQHQFCGYWVRFDMEPKGEINDSGRRFSLRHVVAFKSPVQRVRDEVKELFV